VTIAGTVVVADDTPANIDLLRGLLLRDGYVVHVATNGEEALCLTQELLPDLVVSDVMMPRMNGFDLCRRLKADSQAGSIPVVLVTSLAEREDRIEGLNAGADDFLTKPVNAHELRARVRSLVRLKRSRDDLAGAEALILGLGRSVEARNPAATGHCERMAAYASAFGLYLGLPDKDVTALERAGHLHDIGMIAVPEALLLKQAPLTSDERLVLAQHPVRGASACEGVQMFQLVTPIVRWHHERLDGSGYPDSLRGDAIPALAQIVGIIDTYDALTTARPWRHAVSPGAACVELQREVQCGWRSERLVSAFVALAQSGALTHLTPERPAPLEGACP